MSELDFDKAAAHGVCSRVQTWRRRFVFLILTAWSRRCCKGRARPTCRLPRASVSTHGTRRGGRYRQKRGDFSSGRLLSSLLCLQLPCTSPLRPRLPQPLLPRPALLPFLTTLELVANGRWWGRRSCKCICSLLRKNKTTQSRSEVENFTQFYALFRSSAGDSCSLLWVTLLQQEGWTRWPTEVPSNPYHSVILWLLSDGAQHAFRLSEKLSFQAKFKFPQLITQNNWQQQKPPTHKTHSQSLCCEPTLSFLSRLWIPASKSSFFPFPPNGLESCSAVALGVREWPGGCKYSSSP